MKKIFTSLAIMLVAICSSFLLTACGKPEPTKIEVKDGTLDTTILVNEQLDTSNLVIIVTYDNGKKESIKVNKDMIISAIDPSIIGPQEITIKYLGKEIKLTVNVVANENDLYEIAEFEKPDLQQKYIQNNYQVKDNAGTDFDETENNFKVKYNSYKVGDDNPFIYLPIITALNEEGEDVTLKQYTSKVRVEQITGREKVELIGKDLTDMVAVDIEKSSFDFTEKAIGQTFKITVAPLNSTNPEFLQSMIIEVVDGWNAYNIADLSRIVNTTAGELGDAWKEYKETNHIGNEKINGIVLHDNMIITRNDIPKAFYYNEGDAYIPDGCVDTFKTRVSIYQRDIELGEKFSIYGNYFTVDASKIALSNEIDVDKKDDEIYGHSAIFGFGGDNGKTFSGYKTNRQGDALVENINIIGNGGRSEKAEKKNSLMAIISSAQNLYLNNSIVRAFVTHIDALEGEGNQMIISDSKLYDAYSSLLFCWGTKNTIIKNSILKGAGGPTIMATHVDPEKDVNIPADKTEEEKAELDKLNRYSNVTVIDSELDSPSLGTEGWYGLNGATDLALLFKAIATKMTMVGQDLIANEKIIENPKTLLNNGALNFVSCTLGSAALSTVNPIKGKVTITEGNSTFVSDMQNMLYAGLISTKETSALAGAPLFHANNVFMTLIPGEGIIDGVQEVKGITFIGLSNPKQLIQISIIPGEGFDIGGVIKGKISQLKKPEQFGKEGAAVIAAAINEIKNFYNSKYVEMFYNGKTTDKGAGPTLGAVLETFAVPAK